MNLSLDFGKRISINGFPPCLSNIRRKQFFDKPKVQWNISEELGANFMHDTNLLTRVRKQNNLCSNSWAISTVTCLSDLYGIYEKQNPELDSSLIVSCYTPRNYSKYYKKRGCNGDSPYNAIYFLYTNGTLTDICWKDEDPNSPNTCSKNSILCKDPLLYKIGESPLPGPNPNAFNISPILIDGKLNDSNKNEINIENAVKYMKYKIKQGPVICGFIVLDSFCWYKKDLLNGKAGDAVLDWNVGENNPNRWIYFPKSHENRKIVGYHNAVVVGWGEKKNSVPYWICRNSWGKEWGDNGYWLHAMYPHNLISCPDISIYPYSYKYLKKLPFKDKISPLGGMISITASNTSTQKLKMSELKNSYYIMDDVEEYPDYLWIIIFIVIVLIFAKFVT